MHRPWIIIFSFGTALAVVLAALGWVTSLAVDRDRAEAQARRQAALEENIRLALWRMDSAIAPLIAAENARRPETYTQKKAAPHPVPLQPEREVLPASQTLNEPDAPQAGAELRPGPLHPAPPALHPPAADNAPAQLIPLRVKCYFALQDGIVRLSNDDTQLLEGESLQRVPSRPQGAAEQAPPASPVAETLAAAEQEWEAFRQVLVSQTNWEQLAHSSYSFLLDLADEASLPAEPEDGGKPLPPLDQTQRGAKEYISRAKLLMQNTVPPAAAETSEGDAALAAGPLQPLWIEGRLVLARRIQSPHGEAIQGCWLDWAGIRNDLLAQVRDLLPHADLVPDHLPPRGAAAGHEGPAPQEQSRLMATLPVRLIPGPLPDLAGDRLSPLAVSLALAWSAALVAAIAVAVLLLGVLSLSERRAAFVGAVTHELRTPLTTFRMYAEMLAEGMVRDTQHQRRYLETLLRESERLSHLVENVLAYARLERGRLATLQPIRGDALLAHVVPRLQSRAAAAGHTLHVEAEKDAQSMTVLADPSAVEQILFNLVDNACKYAANADDRRIHLEAKREAACLCLRVRDHGPGFGRTSSRRLFRPFSKSARDAAQTAPGVGLGLALCRRLARGMRGELCTEPPPTQHTAGNQPPTRQPHSNEPHSNQPHASQPHTDEQNSGEPHASQPHASQSRSDEAHAGELHCSEPHSGEPRSSQPHCSQSHTCEPHSRERRTSEPPNGACVVLKLREAKGQARY